MDTCKHGHLLDETNLRIITTTGKRICAECRRINMRRWHQANYVPRPREGPDPIKRAAKLRRKKLKRLGLTPERYDQMAAEQNFLCALCRQPETEHHNSEGNPILSLTVDHDHITKAVRGLLCRRCNRGLGIFHDDIELLNRAIEYLLKGKG